MTAKIIDGKALAARIQDELKTRVEACTEHGHRPGLAVVLVGEDPASRSTSATRSAPASARASALMKSACPPKRPKPNSSPSSTD